MRSGPRSPDVRWTYLDFLIGLFARRAGRLETPILMKPFVLALMILMAFGAKAEERMIEDFQERPETRWRFITDGVMGGVSAGRVDFIREGDQAYARMTGTVSTENNGGFIQMRMALPDGAPEGATGVRLVVRGNGQRYFAHLRTGGTVLPWQYYQAGFEVAEDWGEVRLPFDAFARSGRLLRKVAEAGSLRSIAVVAYGRDHAAEIEVREAGFY